MPTGYTAALYEGKPQTFEEFALEAARAMGAAIKQRDDAPGPIADEYEPSTYYRDALEDAESLLADLKGFGADEWTTRELAKREEETERVQQAIKVAAERRVRYETMLAEVEAWRPPTPEHLKFKEFMVSQLTESIKFDCSTTYLTIPSPRGWQEFRDAELESAERDVERSREGWAEEQERTASRNKWVRDLRESLPSRAGAEVVR